MRNTTKFNLTQQLTHDLGMAIVQGTFEAGDGLPSEAGLCSKYEVSRTATREAVKMLSAKGMLSSRPKHGIRVLPESSWNMFDTDVLDWILNSKPSLALLREFTQMRFAIEPEAAALASQNLSTNALDGIAIALDRMADAGEGLDDHLESDIAFHTSILCASENRFICQLNEFISTALRVSIRYTNKLKGVHGADIEQHRRVFNAIQSGDAELARRAMQALLSEALALINSKLAQ